MRHLWYWEGLRWAPGGLLLLSTAATVTAPMPTPLRWAGWLLATVTAARLHSLAGRYYANWLPDLRPGARTGGGLAATAALITALGVDAWWTPPLLVTAVVGAAILLGYGFATGGGRPHHVVAVALLGALAPLPAVGFVDSGRSRVLVWLVACGLLYAVLAVLDHRELALKRRAWLAVPPRREIHPPRRVPHRAPHPHRAPATSRPTPGAAAVWTSSLASSGRRQPTGARARATGGGTGWQGATGGGTGWQGAGGGGAGWQGAGGGTGWHSTG